MMPSLYDPTISKRIVWGRDRNEAIARMRQALFEYIIVGIKSNISFHKAIMEKPRFIKDELGTHFIDSETTLVEDMKRMMEREKPLEGELPHPFEEKKRITAIASIAVLTQIGGYVQPKQ